MRAGDIPLSGLRAFAPGGALLACLLNQIFQSLQGRCADLLARRLGRLCCPLLVRVARRLAVLAALRAARAPKPRAQPPALCVFVGLRPARAAGDPSPGAALAPESTLVEARALSTLMGSPADC